MTTRIARIVKTETDSISDPKKHEFEPNGNGHAHYSELCWWCGKPKRDHIIACYSAWIEGESK